MYYFRKTNGHYHFSSSKRGRSKCNFYKCIFNPTVIFYLNCFMVLYVALASIAHSYFDRTTNVNLSTYVFYEATKIRNFDL